MRFTLRLCSVVVVLVAALAPACARSRSHAGAAKNGAAGFKNSTLFRGDAFRKTLYGPDDRMEQSQVSDADMLAVGATTAALVRASDLTFNLASRTWTRRYSCEPLAARSPSPAAVLLGSARHPALTQLVSLAAVAAAACRDVGRLARRQRRCLVLGRAVRRSAEYGELLRHFDRP